MFTDNKTKLISIKDFSSEYGIGITQTYSAARSGELPTLRIGRRLWIVREALDRKLNLNTSDYNTKKPYSNGYTQL